MREKATRVGNLGEEEKHGLKGLRCQPSIARTQMDG